MPPPAQGERLQKVLAKAGFGSRRHCEELIAHGRVRVNGSPVELGVRVDPDADRVQVDGVAVELSPRVVYYALHKPSGVLTTASDPKGRPTIMDLLPPEPRVFAVGRLDMDTSGLLLVTNDGDFAMKMTHPRYGIPKTYLAEVSGHAGAGHLKKLRQGVDLQDGPARAERVRLSGAKAGRSLVELTVREGRNRLVRRMLDSVGLPVVSLVRTSVGPCRLGRLKPGTYRALSGAEVLELLSSGAASVD